MRAWSVTSAITSYVMLVGVVVPKSFTPRGVNQGLKLIDDSLKHAIVIMVYAN